VHVRCTAPGREPCCFSVAAGRKEPVPVGYMLGGCLQVSPGASEVPHDLTDVWTNCGWSSPPIITGKDMHTRKASNVLMECAYEGNGSNLGYPDPSLYGFNLAAAFTPQQPDALSSTVHLYPPIILENALFGSMAYKVE
tara:strand:+ start:203 stop:619 length:417 start_codon:yes stop_codon:yes gene_type:complete